MWYVYVETGPPFQFKDRLVAISEADRWIKDGFRVRTQYMKGVEVCHNCEAMAQELLNLEETRGRQAVDSYLDTYKCKECGVENGLNLVMPEPTSPKKVRTKQEVLTDIASTHLSLTTLETRNSDDLDFREQSVWRIKEALEAAYEAGKKHRAHDLLY